MTHTISVRDRPDASTGKIAEITAADRKQFPELSPNAVEIYMQETEQRSSRARLT
jgi:hypothetical protein